MGNADMKASGSFLYTVTHTDSIVRGRWLSGVVGASSNSRGCWDGFSVSAQVKCTAERAVIGPEAVKEERLLHHVHPV